MSLLSQLIPPGGTPPLTISIAVGGLHEPPVAEPPHAWAECRDSGRHVEDAVRLTRSLLIDAPDDRALAQLEAGVDEHVDLWAPGLHTTSRFELVSAMTRLDDAITDLRVTVTGASQSGTTVLLTWFATGRFSHPAFLDDDHLIEPSGAVIQVAGAATVSFNEHHRADRIRCYYDRLSVVEQLMSAPRPAIRR